MIPEGLSKLTSPDSVTCGLHIFLPPGSSVSFETTLFPFSLYLEANLESKWISSQSAGRMQGVALSHHRQEEAEVEEGIGFYGHRNATFIHANLSQSRKRQSAGCLCSSDLPF